MVRKNPDRPVIVGNGQPVTDEQLAQARVAAEAAADRLAEAETADVAGHGWAERYEAAAMAAQSAGRRAEAMEQQRAAYIEQAGHRAAAAKKAAPEIAAMATSLAATRDKVASAAAVHLRSLAGLETAAAEHNALLATSRARLAELGLPAVAGRDGTLGNFRGDGIRAGGTDWAAVPADGIAAHALLQVFGQQFGPRHPFRHVQPYSWMPSAVSARRDGLAMPVLESQRRKAANLAWRSAPLAGPRQS